jgi:acyl carrier protein
MQLKKIKNMNKTIKNKFSEIFYTHFISEEEYNYKKNADEFLIEIIFFIFDIEQEFDIEIEDNKFISFNNIAGISTYIQKILEQKDQLK